MRHLQKSSLSTVLLEQRACPSSSDAARAAGNFFFFAIFNNVDPVWCGCGVKYAMFLLFVCLYFEAKLPNLKRDFLGHFCKKWPCFCAHMKAENLRIPKLSLLLHLEDSKPGLWAIKHDRAFFFRHPVLWVTHLLVQGKIATNKFYCIFILFLLLVLGWTI